MDFDFIDYVYMLGILLIGVAIGAIIATGQQSMELPKEIENTKCVYYEKQIYCLKEE